MEFPDVRNVKIIPIVILILVNPSVSAVNVRVVPFKMVYVTLSRLLIVDQQVNVRFVIRILIV